MKKVERTNMIPDEVIMNKVLIIREQCVMVDSDMAELYGVSTKRLNEAVKRNISRFPIDFMFQLTIIEKEELAANCDHLKKDKGESKNRHQASSDRHQEEFNRLPHTASVSRKP